MKVNNFRLIERLLFRNLDNSDVSTNTDKILLGRIIRRRKENPDDSKPEYIVKRYSFANLQSFLDREEEIKTLCHMFNARFYISVSIKSMRDIAYDISEEVPKFIRHEQYYFFRRIFDDMADKNRGVKEHRLWIFDIDNTDHVNPVIEKLFSLGVFVQNSQGMIPTLNGAHLLMKPHDIRYMNDSETISSLGGVKLKDIVDIKRNALTLVYYSDEHLNAPVLNDDQIDSALGYYGLTGFLRNMAKKLSPSEEKFFNHFVEEVIGRLSEEDVEALTNILAENLDISDIESMVDSFEKDSNLSE
jgi:hypothetical protein